jgi:hypothetical protein
VRRVRESLLRMAGAVEDDTQSCVRGMKEGRVRARMLIDAAMNIDVRTGDCGDSGVFVLCSMLRPRQWRLSGNSVCTPERQGAV